MFKALLLVLALSHGAAKHRAKAERPAPSATAAPETPARQVAAVQESTPKLVAE
ncbi:hypothetical protein [Hymenobacter rubripertinctus]|uniref:hypothetical protein n=1 Tax=Hymenobacter rubripertinctus TaxID=2029981 RepID=UPI0016023792|nr:hypothetical protein [Hymenobacter rubripertinctus]